MTHSPLAVRFGLFVTLLAIFSSPACAQTNDPYDSGGVMLPEQAAYDVIAYDLALTVNPDRQTIAGTLTVSANVISPLSWFVLDLDPRFDVTSVTDELNGKKELFYEFRGARLWIKPTLSIQPRTSVEYTVAYHGAPRIAPNPPWDGGFQWEKTASGEPWIATSCQMIGADMWWPVKDHVSDEPETMKLHIRVPEPLVVASNGRLDSVESHGDGTRTYHWNISNPINSYNVALNIAPYRVIEDTFTSVAGDTFPIQFFVLPEDYDKGLELFEEIKDHLAFYEKFLGPYPFRADKYGVAQTPHLGMEHQTIIAYGAGFDNTSMTRGNDLGFDALHHHELAHEWWGNLVTNSEWSDIWLHEGFGSYMQPLYREQLFGKASYNEAMMQQRRGIQNTKALSPREVLSSQEIYAGHDIYSKGSWVLHTLRFLVGDDLFFQILRRQAYPDPAMELVTDGSQTRFGTTADFQQLAEDISGRNLNWFFETYVRNPELPEIKMIREGALITVFWNHPLEDIPFPMPIEITIDGQVKRYEVPDFGSLKIPVPEGAVVRLDPENKILRKGNKNEN
jgi:aminopeptidase N